MTATLRLPKLGETMEDGVVTAWLAEPGAAFARGDALVEVETDKMAVEVPALGPGVLVELLVAPGDRVAVGAPIARIDLAGGPDWTGDDEEPAPSAAPAASAEAPAPPATATVPPARPGAPVRATPPARRAARAAGIDLATLAGTGRRGRIEQRDIPSAASGSAGEAVAGGVAYTASGPADGAPVLLLHGFAADRSAWAALASGLARSGRRVLAADLPGHGRTALEAAVPDDLGAPLGPLADAAGGRPHLVAHSLGAAAAVALARDGRAASLTLIAPAGLGLAIDAEFIRGLAAPGSAAEVAHLLRRLSDRPLPLSDAAVAAIHADLARGRLRRLAQSILGPAGQALDLVGAIDEASRRMPVRVVVGHRDRIVDWQDALRLPSRVALHHMPSAGHMPHWDAPAEVLEILGRLP